VNLTELAERWGFSPESPYLRQALTHRSAAPRRESNERLEFLGDALLGFFVARLLMEALPEADEGTLTLARSNIVDRETQADAAQALGLPELLHVDLGGRKAGLPYQTRPLSDAFEALIAALYLDAGEASAVAFVEATLAEAIQAALADPTLKHPKTRLQELVQGRSQRKPEYRVVANTSMEVTVEVLGESGTVLGRGFGRTHRSAERTAAEAALRTLTEPHTGAKL